jgi:hypothetical protein
MKETEFLTLLNKHDWTYQHSDDHKAWQAGDRSWKQIQRVMENNPKLRAVFDSFKANKDI